MKNKFWIPLIIAVLFISCGDGNNITNDISLLGGTWLQTTGGPFGYGGFVFIFKENIVTLILPTDVDLESNGLYQRLKGTFTYKNNTITITWTHAGLYNSWYNIEPIEVIHQLKFVDNNTFTLDGLLEVDNEVDRVKGTYIKLY